MDTFNTSLQWSEANINIYRWNKQTVLKKELGEDRGRTVYSFTINAEILFKHKMWSCFVTILHILVCSDQFLQIEHYYTMF